MQHFCADLHIHIGSARGKAVKITASRNLQLKSIIFEDAPRKGLDIVGVVDAGSLSVADEIDEMLQSGELVEQDKGGLLAKNGVLIIPGCEVETREGIHVIIYLRDLQSIKKWQRFLRSRVHNMVLSTQKADASTVDIINMSVLLDGIFCPAHAFTPHKGAYGVWTSKLEEKIGEDIKQVKTLELGLSADTDLADMMIETRNFTYLSNSDAHSAANIGREYNLLQMKEKNFEELKLCIENTEGRHIVANYGMDPRLGKYHRSFCPDCEMILEEEAPVRICPVCKNKKIVMGVYDRIVEIKDYDSPRHPAIRPPYYYRVPLKDLPGVGPKTYLKILSFWSEIEVKENVELEKIERIVGKQLTRTIAAMRQGKLEIIAGGGGKYGKVKKNTCQY